MQEVEIIVAISKNGVIGSENAQGLPWNIPEDLAHFRTLTTGHIVVMGHRTWESLPYKPLKDRINVIISSKKDADYTPIEELDERLRELKESYPEKRIFIIGGAQLYGHFLRRKVERMHVTHIDKTCNGSISFPLDGLDAYRITDYSEKFWSDSENCTYQYITYDIYEEERKRTDRTYTGLVCDILTNGKNRPDRTGTGTRSVFGRQLCFNLNGSIPLLTTKFVPWKACIKELLWFLKGQTDATILKSQGVGIWDGNTSREFLDSRGLAHLPAGDIGAGYGFQWRHSGGAYKTCKDTYDDTVGFDQVADVLHLLRNDPYSRRIYMSAWTPGALKDMALPPCHVSAQFYVEDDDKTGEKFLSCHMYQRSVDVFLGLPFNIFSYATLTYIFAAMTGMKTKELIISTGDTHIYNDHIAQVQEQIARTPYMEPVLHISTTVKEKTIDELTIEDFDMVGYFHHPVLKGKMAV